jgi:small neutral amino acid transporter SnatA (MarC family)
LDIGIFGFVSAVLFVVFGILVVVLADFVVVLFELTGVGVVGRLFGVEHVAVGNDFPDVSVELLPGVVFAVF